MHQEEKGSTLGLQLTWHWGGLVRITAVVVGRFGCIHRIESSSLGSLMIIYTALMERVIHLRSMGRWFSQSSVSVGPAPYADR